jgi:thymidylate synthase ThyX
MQPQKVEADRERCEAVWNIARENAIASATNLQALGVHKEVVNRLLEPFLFITTLITSTEWDNFFKQRLAHDAQSEIRLLAEEMCEAIKTSAPAQRWWHRPFSDDIRQSVARCARVSYNKEGRESTLDEDTALYEKLKADGHWSPFEHVAHTGGAGVKSGNFTGWTQHRQEVQKWSLT